MPTETPYETLCKGNTRFINGETLKRDHVSRRAQLVSGQHPYAAVITCSDSRIAPEYLFDAGLGELFIVRNAGNVIDVNVLASIEYAVLELGVELVVVLGHEGCGAVNAACSTEEHDGNIAALMKELEESVKRGNGNPEKAIIENMQLSMDKLQLDSEHLRNRMQEGKLTIKGGVYSLDTGIVQWRT